MNVEPCYACAFIVIFVMAPDLRQRVNRRSTGAHSTNVTFFFTWHYHPGLLGKHPTVGIFFFLLVVKISRLIKKFVERLIVRKFVISGSSTI